MTHREFSEKLAEISSRTSKKVWSDVKPSTPSEKEIVDRYGKPFSHPGPKQNESIRNYPVTGKNKASQASDPVIKQSSVAVHRIMERLLKPGYSKKYLRGLSGKFKSGKIINYIKS